ncbi:TIGR03943 family protein [Robertmurraya sp. DFI.2.37]|uniref:TIGR03943 family putative permease subunit n=1 Tax=Robertmurraya sp. DFI.2.37 TaxID=3031819 RepID=UPI001246DF07|nr:TIGR03943 family protein [Robertmurraya sp. DFI.2.37]MDF1507082.1 TIGR03943 family protein [Robertmurraya sp. DFI.2.37]
MVRVRFQHLLKAALLAAFALFFMKLHLTGEISNYINPKYEIMSIIASWVFFLLFLIQLFRIWGRDDIHIDCSPACSHSHNGGTIKFIHYAIILFPLVTGFALPPTTLGASIAVNKGSILPHAGLMETHDEVISNENYMNEEEYNRKLASLEQAGLINMSSDMYSSYHGEMISNPEAFAGRKIKLSAFVYKEQGLEKQQFILARFLITHCIADASVLGLLTEFKQMPELKEDSWVELEGTIEVTTIHGQVLPVIKASDWRIIDEPIDPYVYPVLVKIV